MVDGRIYDPLKAGGAKSGLDPPPPTMEYESHAQVLLRGKVNEGCKDQGEVYSVKAHKLLQVGKQVVTSLFTSCQQVLFALLVPSLL